LGLVLLAALPASAQDAVRVRADGAAPLPPRLPGAPAPKPPDAASLRALRQIAVENGAERAVLEHAAGLARPEVRDDETALRAALGDKPADFTLGVGVVGEIGPREAKAAQPAGAPAPPPRRPSDPVPMEYAWRVEALVDSARVRAALAAAGLALASEADAGAASEVVLLAPYDAPMLAALRAQLGALGARNAVPRRYEADGVTLLVHGLSADSLREGLAADPPAGYGAELVPSSGEDAEIRVRLRPQAAPGAPPNRPTKP
jgi:hypothetical protein